MDIQRKSNIESMRVMKGILGNVVNVKVKQKTETKLERFITNELLGSAGQ